jgi:hypothetical protein
MTKIAKAEPMTPNLAAPDGAFPANEELRITFEPFKVRIVFHEGRRLTITVTEGDNAGFTDTVDYRAVLLRDGITVLSWQEHIGSAIVHVLDFPNKRTLTYVTPAKGGFLQLVGALESSEAG